MLCMHAMRFCCAGAALPPLDYRLHLLQDSALFAVRFFLVLALFKPFGTGAVFQNLLVVGCDLRIE